MIEVGRAANTTLVCLIGRLSGGNIAHESLIANVLQPLRADLALLLRASEAADKGTQLLFRNAQHIWLMNDDWNAQADELAPGWEQTLLQGRSNTTAPQEASRAPDPKLWGGLFWRAGNFTLRGTGGLLMVLRLALLARLDALGEAAYDQVIVTRPDHYHACKHPQLVLKRGEVAVPEGEEYGGITDRHITFPFASRSHVLRMLPWLATHDNQRMRLWSFESALRAFLVAQRLSFRKVARTMVILTDDSSSGSWRPGHGPVPPGPLPGFCTSPDMWLKYPFEYVAMAGTCNLTLSPCQRSSSKLIGYMEYCQAARRNVTAVHCGMALAKASIQEQCRQAGNNSSRLCRRSVVDV